MQEFKFRNIYSLASLIDESVDYKENFWNFDVNYFINASTNFSKDTLLHQYIVTRSFNHYHRYFRKDGDCIVDDEAEQWMSLLSTYGIIIRPLNLDNGEDPYDWFIENEEKFYDLFDRMANEVFHVLFANRNFLIKFNLLTTKTVQELIDKTYPFEHCVYPDAHYPKDKLNNKGRIKRKSIPSWVKNAVFHRDKGRCVYCNIDLTGVVNNLTAKNFDHMVPLDLFGTNDPCNIQLTCETCNKSKSNSSASTGFKYQTWWPIDN